ncbi:acyltransferase [Streptomyces sp. NPDC094448]|uniref:acyltransferase n=1 Tax=Streptomyces sp. NPDC094448 TaxID=3366063 RepID=UPI0037F3AE5D
MSTEATLRLTVAAIMQLTRERQVDVGAGTGLSQLQISRKQAGKTAWTLGDVDALAAHWRVPVLDLLAGPTRATAALPADRIATPPTQTLIPLTDCTEPADGRPSPPPRTPASGHHGNRTAEPARRTAEPAAHPPQLPTTAPAAPSPPPQPDRDPAPSADQPRNPVPRRATPALPPTDRIRAAVNHRLQEADGDIDTARAALIKHAIPDVMALFSASRVGGRYEHTEFPPTQEILQKRSQKGADQIWEGRPKWRSVELHQAARAGHIHLDVTALDINGAYLAALKTWLPIGRLTHTKTTTHDPKRAGVHRITPPDWTHRDLPSPLGARQEPGPLWVTEPTLRLFLRCAGQGLCKMPVIHESWTSGASEGLLEKMRRALADTRERAIQAGDDLTLDYIKAMYSKFVSTIGESTANREIRRPDWMHIIRSQAFANLWMKAHKAHVAGLTVVEISGTDELHIAGEWQSVFAYGRGLSQVKPKYTYTLGEGES